MVERFFAGLGFFAAAVTLAWFLLSGIQKLHMRMARRRPLPPMDPEIVRELQMARSRLPYLMADDRMWLHAELKDLERGERP
ncbi:hypothetical protein ACIBEJ_34720 [Nonomuraea sp. NPDC050790]|uniref:hypothetical protein n=1 Tax=Nonomuraea sp. NPDC050790 TaxID=3364371 RepID=UPI0037BC40C2